jgi:ribonuclease HI
MVLYALCDVFVYSCFAENPTIWSWETNPSFLRWFCHSCAHPPEGDILKYAIQLEFSTTNNITEYKGLVTRLQLAKYLSIQWLLIRGDSQLVAKQVQKEYDCNNEKMVEYLAEVHKIEKFFDGFEVQYVPRLHNYDTNHLAWIASSRAPTPPDVIIERLYKCLVKPAKPTNEAIKQDLMAIDEPE